MLHFFCLALLLTATLPGAPTTPAQLGTSVSLRSNEAGRLVLIRGAQTSGVEPYKSRSGLAGLWETFQGVPSFTLKHVVAAGSSAPVSTAPITAARNLLRIRDAFVPEGSVRKITKSQTVTFTFLVGSESYQGVMYADSWTSEALDLLRSGRVTLYGHWKTLEGRPNFVTTRVTP